MTIKDRAKTDMFSWEIILATKFKIYSDSIFPKLNKRRKEGRKGKSSRKNLYFSRFVSRGKEGGSMYLHPSV